MTSPAGARRTDVGGAPGVKDYPKSPFVVGAMMASGQALPQFR